MLLELLKFYIILKQHVTTELVPKYILFLLVALMLIGYLDIFFSLYACIKNIKKQKEKEENYSGMPVSKADELDM